MHYSSCNAGISVCLQHIVNLSINTVTYEIFQAIECLQNLLRYNGSQDAHLNFKMEVTLLNEKIITNQLHNGYYISVRVQGGCIVIMKLFSSCFRLLYCIMAAGFVLGP